MLLTLLLSGCATEFSSEREPWLEGNPNAFEVLEIASGLGRDDRLWSGLSSSPPQVRELLRRLSRTPVTLRSLAPRQALLWLLRDLLEGEEPIHGPELRWRARRFESLVMVRPDGYLVMVLTGEPLQRMGQA